MKEFQQLRKDLWKVRTERSVWGRKVWGAGRGFLAAESPAAFGARPAEKSLPRDPALVLSTGKLYKLNTLLFS